MANSLKKALAIPWGGMKWRRRKKGRKGEKGRNKTDETGLKELTLLGGSESLGLKGHSS